MYHVPVLQHEIAQLLSSLHLPRLLIDATLGDGGHALLMHRVCPAAQIIGIDADGAMLRRAMGRLAAINTIKRRMHYVHGWFDDLFDRLSAGWARKQHLLQWRHLQQLHSQRHYSQRQRSQRQRSQRQGLQWQGTQRQRLQRRHPQRQRQQRPSATAARGHSSMSNSATFQSSSLLRPLTHSARHAQYAQSQLTPATHHSSATQLQTSSSGHTTSRLSTLQSIASLPLRAISLLRATSLSHATSQKSMARAVRKVTTRGADFILFDLGISTAHYTLHNMGFSFAEDEPLDMRLDTTATLTAAHIVNRAPLPLLEQLLWHYGNERHYRRIAHEIYQAARQHPIETTGQLVGVIKRAYPNRHLQRDFKQHAGRRTSQRSTPYRHFATKTFMALRIAVNNEFRRLMRVLPLAFHQLKRGGLLACITFHSGEDRIVKHFFQFVCGMHGENIVATSSATTRGAVDWSSNGDGGRNRNDGARHATATSIAEPAVCARHITKKPMVPSRDEIIGNRAARSAKLRAVQKIGTMSSEWLPAYPFSAIDVQSLC